ncbi:hypothetical protein D3C87_1957480 [compost metagenome]
MDQGQHRSGDQNALFARRKGLGRVMKSTGEIQNRRLRQRPAESKRTAKILALGHQEP